MPYKIFVWHSLILANLFSLYPEISLVHAVIYVLHANTCKHDETL